MFDNVDLRFFDFQKRTEKDIFDIKTRRLQPLEEVTDWCKTTLQDKEFMRDIEERFSTFEKRYKQEYAELSHMAAMLEDGAREQIKSIS